MNYREEVRDLFSVPDDYFLAHCISADFEMGKGIAVEFKRRFDMKRKLQNRYPEYSEYYRNRGLMGDCIPEGRVLNLITKESYWQKPTRLSMCTALIKMRNICQRNGIKKIAMPLIGAGLDRLAWNDVSELIKHVFENTDTEILVCRLN